MPQNRTIHALAPARAKRALAAVALTLLVLAGCAPRLQSSNGTIGPYPENHEALIRDYAGKRWYVLGSYKIASVSAPVPGSVVVEAKVGFTYVPAAVSIGWIVRTIGTGKLWLGGLIPTPFDISQTYYWLLRDGEVKAYLLNGYEEWERGRRYVKSFGQSS